MNSSILIYGAPKNSIMYARIENKPTLPFNRKYEYLIFRTNNCKISIFVEIRNIPNFQPCYHHK